MSQSEEEKLRLRAALRARRRSLADDERQRLSRRAAAHLLASDVWRKAASVALYVAVRGEADATPLLEAARQSGKTALLPLCLDEATGEPGLMRFVPCAGAHALRIGAYGIPEPVCASLPVTDPPADIILVPGVAFDTKGMRLGQGGGYYDRLLARPEYAKSLRIGYAYAFQIVDAVPARAWDVPMHALCTEEGLVWI